MTMALSFSASILAFVFCCQIFIIEAVLPGFDARITKKGLNYVNTAAHNVLAKELASLKIPDQSGSSGHIQYSLWSIQVTSHTVPSSSMTFTPSANALSWGLTNLGIGINTHWRVKYHKAWVHASTSGSADIKASQISAQVSIRLGKDSQGRPSISLASCSANVGSVHIDFHGGTAWILNLFKHTLESKIKGMLNDQICKIVTKEINSDGESEMQKIPITIMMDHRFLLDYRLVSAPVVQANYLETKHKGEVFWVNVTTEAPFAPKPLSGKGDETRMVNLWMTDYMANTYAYVAQKNNFLQYNLTKNDLPSDNSSFLNTTCGFFKCVGSLIPQIAKKYPNSTVEIHMASTAAPMMTISSKNITMAMQGNLNFYANTPEHEMAYLLTLNVSFQIGLNVTVVKERVMSSIVSHSFKLGVVKSDVGPVSGMALNLIFKAALNFRILPMLDSVLKKGAQLPVTGKVEFQNTQLTLIDGSLFIASDLLYNGTRRDQSLRFVPEGSM